MDSRERYLIGAHGFDFDWWIFSISFTVRPLESMQYPRWFARLMCKIGKHNWWIDGLWLGRGRDGEPTYRCSKCGELRDE